MKINKFEDLEIWQNARTLCIQIFHLSNKIPFSKDFQLRDQVRASSGSIMDNISEGFERGGRKEFIQFLSIAKGSCGETKSQIYRAVDYKYITEEEFNDTVIKTETLGKKIGALIQYLKKTPYTGTKFK